MAKKRQQRPITAPTVRHFVSRGEREICEHRECDRGERREPQEVTLGERVISPFGVKPPKRSTSRKGEREKEGDNDSDTNSGSQGPHDDEAGRKSAAGTREHKNSREARCNTGDRATKERSNRTPPFRRRRLCLVVFLSCTRHRNSGTCKTTSWDISEGPRQRSRLKGQENRSRSARTSVVGQTSKGRRGLRSMRCVDVQRKTGALTAETRRIVEENGRSGVPTETT